MLGRDVSQLSDDQLRNLVAELERRFRDEALTSAAQAATIILDGVKADRWRILVGADAHKVDEMVRQSPERAYDIAFFDEFARARGGPSASLSRTPNSASRIDHRPIWVRCERYARRRCGGTFCELDCAGETPEPHTPLIPGATHAADRVM